MAKAATTTELAARAGITLRQVEFWCGQGYIRSVTNGSGSTRVIEPREQRILEAMARIVRAGIHPALASRIARRAVEVAERDTASRARIRISQGDDPGISVTIDGL